MALKKNVFDPILFEFLDTLRGLRLAGHVADTQSQNNRTLLSQALEEARQATPEPAEPAIGTTYDVPVPNPFEENVLSYGHTHCHDEEMLRLVIELSRRFQATTICMVYEAIERFLKEFAPPLFFAARKQWEPASRAAFHKREPALAKEEARNTRAYFEGYVRFLTAHNCNKLITELRRKLPAFRDHGEQGGIFVGYELTAYIRHTTVHGSGEPCTVDLRRQSSEVQEAVAGMTGRSVVTGRDTILPTEIQATRLLTSAAAFGYTLYRTASEHLRMKVASLS